MVTNIPGLYAMGECNYQYHGANRLGANSLVSCIFDGLFAAPGLQRCSSSLPTCAADLPASLYERRDPAARGSATSECCSRPAGGENPYLLHQASG